MSAHVSRGCGAWLGIVALGALVQACGDSAKGGDGAGGAGGQAVAGSTSSAGKSNSAAGTSSSNGGKSQGGASSNGGKSSSGGGGFSSGGDEPGGTPSNGGSDSGGSDSGGSGGSNNGGSGNAVKSAGCGKAAPLAQAKQQSVMVGTDARGYFLVPPAGYDSKKAYALVFAYHGAGGNGEGLRSYFGLEAASKGEAIFVYPDGLGGIWDLKNDGPDAKLFDSVLTTIEDAWCVDKGSVFAAGFSYGGWAATQMGKARPAQVRAVASIEGGGPQGAGAKDAAVAAIIVHGSNDGAEPLASGVSSRDHFLATNGCGASSSDVTPAPCKAYSGCMPGKAVEWCEHPGGHEIPGFASAGIWSFFASLR